MSKKVKDRRFKTREQFVQTMSLSFLASGRFVTYAYARGTPLWTGRLDAEGRPILGRGSREGMFLAWEQEDGTMRYGWSLRHPTMEEKPFNRYEGLYLAIVRSMDDSDTTRLPEGQHENFAKFVQSVPREREIWEGKLARETVPEAS
jgi:hypothetical protein